METKEMRVSAFMTAPRYENVWVRNVIQHSLGQLKIPLAVSGGVYYGQCMQRMLEDAIRKDTEFALTVDGDSVFTADNVMRLMGLMAGDDSIDAIAAMQCRRGRPEPLMITGLPTIELPDGTKGIEWTGEPIKCKTAHFGLTVIRLDRLKDVPKPWFWSKPDADGSWNTDKIDDDIWFWKQWNEAGRTLFVDPGCSIGHLEEVVTVFDEEMQVKQLYPEQWRDANIPGMTVKGAEL